jgi:hypothetical protein
MSRRRAFALVLAGGLIGAMGCQSKVTAGTGRTERERDSVIGHSAIPGAGAVQRALDVSDSANARRAALDSAAANP